MIAGVAGKYCSGKSKAAAFLVSKGFLEIDLDRLGHKALKSMKKQIVETFGREVLDESGEVNRRTLGTLVFRNRASLHTLETILHPHMKAEVAEVVRNNPKRDIVINGALLFYMDLHRTCDLIFWIRAPLLTRIRRAMKRDGLPLFQLLKRFYSQRSLTPQHSSYDVDIYYVDNRGPGNVLETGIQRILAERG